jgi:hypothetical protein
MSWRLTERRGLIRCSAALPAMSASRLAVAYADLGQAERAQETVERGVEIVRERSFPVGIAIALTMKSRVLQKTQGAAASEAIESALAEAEALVQRTGISSWQPFIHVERAELARLRGDEERGARELGEAHRLFTKMKATGHMERLAREIGS